MKTFCVSNHHNLGPNPLQEQGVLLTASMLKNGVWRPHGIGYNKNSDDHSHVERDFHRSENQQEYLLLLEVLLEMSHNQDDLVAVISLMWDSHFNWLWTPKRVWMGIYLGEKLLVQYSHKHNNDPVHSILSLYENPVFDKDVWRRRFAADIQAGRQSQAA